MSSSQPRQAAGTPPGPDGKKPGGQYGRVERKQSVVTTYSPNYSDTIERYVEAYPAHLDQDTSPIRLHSDLRMYRYNCTDGRVLFGVYAGDQEPSATLDPQDTVSVVEYRISLIQDDEATDLAEDDETMMGIAIDRFEYTSWGSRGVENLSYQNRPVIDAGNKIDMGSLDYPDDPITGLRVDGHIANVRYGFA